ncbi:O-antigen ligase [Rhodococcus wratislaviensis]|uniref:Lipid A core - O-antigen ligase and related enzymes n=2 Tax=Rhodococcus wratislaviensis TaxID=44752 RepID=A0AB38FGY8_RHOWR|nr:O-antigen ligase [Rhodococcus wratislaviensis]SPZ40845.1 Lipid A core - O-antigen ligase and related enzymes [Rhodococcus wratislaviensis]
MEGLELRHATSRLGDTGIKGDNEYRSQPNERQTLLYGTIGLGLIFCSIFLPPVSSSLSLGVPSIIWQALRAGAMVMWLVCLLRSVIRRETIPTTRFFTTLIIVGISAPLATLSLLEDNASYQVVAISLLAAGVGVTLGPPVYSSVLLWFRGYCLLVVAGILGFGAVGYTWRRSDEREVIIASALNQRLQGFLAHPNLAGQLLVIGIFLEIIILRRSSSDANRRTLPVVLSVAIISCELLLLLMTNSRTSAVALAVGLLAFALPGSLRKWTAIIALAVSLGPALVVLARGLGFADDYRFPPGLFTGRGLIWTVSEDALVDNFVLGVGPTQSIKTSEQSYTLFSVVDAPHAHNFFLESWLVTGLVGVLAAVVAVGYLLLAQPLSRDSALLVVPVLVFSLTEVPLIAVSGSAGAIISVAFFAALTKRSSGDSE